MATNLVNTKRNAPPTEASEQIAFVKWFKANYNTPLWHIPSGAMIGGRNRFGAINQLKSMGWCNGIPDIFIPEWKLWIEMKRAKGGTVSSEQKAILKMLNQSGYHAFVARGCGEAIAIVESFIRGKNDGSHSD